VSRNVNDETGAVIRINRPFYSFKSLNLV